MKVTRCANAGVLLEADNSRILLDGVCGKCLNYLETPDEIRSMLLENPPDGVFYTHFHNDHYCENFATSYSALTLRPVFGSEFPFRGKVGSVNVTAVRTRHIGKAKEPHVSYVIEGSKCVWFLGDASPLDVKGKVNDLPKADVLIVPYAYFLTKSAADFLKSLDAEKIILVHMPKEEADEYGIWQGVRENLADFDNVAIPDMGETVSA